MSGNFSTNIFKNENSQNFFGLNLSLANSRAKIEESNGKIYVVIDGRRIEADKNDLFGMNKSNPNEWLEKLVKMYDEEMQKNKEKLNFLEKQEESIKAAIKKVKNAFWALLAKCKANNINEISDENKRKEAISLNEQKWNLTFTKTGINNQIHSTHTSNLIAACNKGKYSNQISVNNAIASKLLSNA